MRPSLPNPWRRDDSAKRTNHELHITLDPNRKYHQRKPITIKLNEQKILYKLSQPHGDNTTCSSTDIYHICRTHHFRWKGQCTTEIQLLNTPHDRRCCHGRQAMTPLWSSSINTLCFPQKLALDFSRPGVGATTILATKITCWHGNADGDCSRFKLKFAFNKQNIGWYERKWPASCYNWDLSITQWWLYCFNIWCFQCRTSCTVESLFSGAELQECWPKLCVDRWVLRIVQQFCRPRTHLVAAECRCVILGNWEVERYKLQSQWLEVYLFRTILSYMFAFTVANYEHKYVCLFVFVQLRGTRHIVDWSSMSLCWYIHLNKPNFTNNCVLYYVANIQNI